MAKTSGGLGKGIGALFGEMAPAEEEQKENLIQMVPIGQIDPNKNQPRKQFDMDALDQLAASIRSVGFIQPIVLSPNGKRYTIVAGERRWRAARMAELTEIPAIVRDVEEVQRMEMMLIENIQRTDLNPMEEAQAINGLMQQCGLTQEQVAQRLGKSRSAVANLLRMLNLPKEVADLVAAGELSEGHARALLGAESERDMINLSNQVVQRGLNVRQTEALVKFMKEERQPKPERPRCAELSLVEEAARMRFGTKVTITGNERHGKLILHYNTPEDLERIYEFIRLHDD
jgi:ParB family chromosome partitioning protein